MIKQDVEGDMDNKNTYHKGKMLINITKKDKLQLLLNFHHNRMYCVHLTVTIFVHTKS